ncbi:Imm1 family immunity protein [Lentzea sp. BCCO 10_0856]|uniref:Imm1 family immunity protein n=1 Tax=Lentzea miocenica TaxID=3095431 RepID=A0ABU4T6F5_9PSEU|nr:Imm1 family immunity protein [Lentzea sp. BCCO 10_0856]MDX8033669.1 Imm1 family immunity protein [Lentzea sp. BCCO 10_0856]
MAPEIVRNRMIVTAVLTTGIARVTHGLEQSEQLIDEVLRTDHAKWETTMSIGDVEFRSTKEGPQPNHQLRISVRPSLGLAALNYTDHDDPEMAIANSYNPRRPLPEVDLIFNGTTGMVFPRTALISIDDARSALSEWLGTCKRPACIQWRPYEPYGSD